MRNVKFLKDSNFAKLIVFFGLSLLFIIWGGLYYKVQSEYRLEIDGAVKETKNLSIAMEENAVSTIKGLDEITVFLKIQYEQEGKSIDIPRYIKEGRFKNQPCLFLSVVDENGDIVASSKTPFESANLSDREHFQVHITADIGLYISKPVKGKVLNKWAIQLTRRINKPDGSFGGIVAVSVDPFYFAEFYQKVDLGKDSVIAIVGRDGILRVRQSGYKVDVGLDFSKRINNELASGGVGYYIDKSIVDGITRVFNYRTLQEYPLIVAVAQSEEEVLKGFNKRVNEYYWICGAMSTLIILFCTLLMIGLGRRRRGEELLKNISMRFELAARAGGVGIWDYDIVNGKLLWDEQMFALYGIKEKDFSGFYDIWQKCLHPDDRLRGDFEMQQALNGEKEFDTEFRVCWPNGAVRNIKSLAIVRRDEDGKVLNVIGTNWDITHQKQVEKELIMAKEEAEAANVAKSQFLANMSHEIRTPINGIFGFLELLHNSQLTKEQREYIHEVKYASEILLCVINDILDFSKIEAGKLTMEKINFNLRNLIEDSVALFVPKAYEKQLELNSLIKANIPHEIKGDPSRLRQILNNLISNALKFTSVGEIIIEVQTIGEVNGIATIEFKIKDSGIGIDEEGIEKIFKPFSQADASTTRKFGGTGLGLVITKELVTIMGGDIKIESIPNQGTVFCFTVQFEIVNQGAMLCLEYANLKNVNVMIVDNNDSNRKIVREYLEDVGCKVVEAASGSEAISVILNNVNAKNKLQIMLINYKMPEMNGYELATTLKTIPYSEDLKLILLTSIIKKSDAIKGKECGFTGFLSKPIKRAKLLDCIGIALGLKEDIIEIPQITVKNIQHEHNSVVPLKILLVEDNEINRKVIIKMLKSRGLTCDVAMDGKEGYQAVVNKEYDLVFMDCQMPIMDGYRATEKIRNTEAGNKHTKIIAMTANSMAGDREKCIEAGMDDYISKPIDFEIMFKIIAETVGYKGETQDSLGFTYKDMKIFMEQTGFDEGDAIELFELFNNSLLEMMNVIEVALEQNDFEEISICAHRIKGTAGNLRVKEIYEMAMLLEDFAIKNDKDNCTNMVLEIKKFFA